MKLYEIFNSRYYERKWKKERKNVPKKHPEIQTTIIPVVQTYAGHSGRTI